MGLPELARWAGIKGIDLLGTGDFTHPEWFGSLREQLREESDGVYRYGDARFLISGELSAIWSQDGRQRRIHLVVFVPSLDAAERVNRQLSSRGNLGADGRPMFGLSAKALVELIWEVAPEAFVIPAHVWTPWYSIFGAKSGFDSLEECFGGLADRITAIETGLSSDPPMNRRVSRLDRLALVSFSDAHSPARLGREATVFDLPDLTFPAVAGALGGGGGLAGTTSSIRRRGSTTTTGIGSAACPGTRPKRERMPTVVRCAGRS